MVTELGTGTVAGAVYVAAEGLETDGAMVPVVELPPTTPLTSHMNAAPESTQREALKFSEEPVSMVAVGGEREPDEGQVMVTLATADLDGSATLTAMTLTSGGEGGTRGAV